MVGNAQGYHWYSYAGTIVAVTAWVALGGYDELLRQPLQSGLLFLGIDAGAFGFFFAWRILSGELPTEALSVAVGSAVLAVVLVTLAGRLPVLADGALAASAWIVEGIGDWLGWLGGRVR